MPKSNVSGEYDLYHAARAMLVKAFGEPTERSTLIDRWSIHTPGHKSSVSIVLDYSPTPSLQVLDIRGSEPFIVVSCLRDPEHIARVVADLQQRIQPDPAAPRLRHPTSNRSSSDSAV